MSFRSARLFVPSLVALVLACGAPGSVASGGGSSGAGRAGSGADVVPGAQQPVTRPPVAAVEGAQDGHGTRDLVVGFEGLADLPVLPGSRTTLTLVVGRPKADGSGVEPLALRTDLALELQAEHASLFTVDGKPVERDLRLPAGTSQVALQVQLPERVAGGGPWNPATVRLRRVRSTGGERVDVGPAPDAQVRLWARAPRNPVMAFGHATPETWPHPVAKVQRRGSEGYWGFRLLDGDVRTPSGHVGGGRATVDEPLELVLALTGDARVGSRGDGTTDVILYDHRLRGGDGPGRQETPLAVVDGRVTLQVDAKAPGWALWASFPDVRDGATLRTLELHLVEVRGARSGRRYDIGWNDRAEWAIVP